MARDFNGTTDNVNLGSAAGLDDIFANDATLLLCINADAIPPGAAGSFVAKSGAVFIFAPAATIIQCVIGRATQSLTVTATYANMSTIAAGAYCWVAVTYDCNGANGDQQLWHGNLTTPIAEAAAYGIQRVGSGTVTDTSGADMLVGGRSTNTLGFDGKIAFIGAWNRRLSREELIAQQHHPHVTSGCVAFNWLGLGPTTDADWSGNGNNGTVTGTTLFPNAPVLPLYGGVAG